MTTYTFHHYETGGSPSGITFAEFATDEEALAAAQRLLEWHSLGCVDVCDGSREVGKVCREDEAAAA